MRLDELTPMFVEEIPESVENGILYISMTYRTATHLCPCGCGNRVVTPLKSGFWAMSERGGRVTIRPSIGSFNLPCLSHYFITDNKVEWLSAAQEGTNNA